MRIIICTHGLHMSGGMERVITNKANYLAQKYNYEVVILTYEKSEEQFFKLDSKVKVINLGIDYLKVSDNKNIFIRKIKNIYKFKKHQKRFEEIVKRLNPDIITTWERISSSICINSNIKCKKIIECHVDKKNFIDVERKNLIYKILDRYRNKKEKDNIGKWDKLIVLTNEGKLEWEKEKNIKNIEVIPNFLSFYPLKTSECKNKTIISVGRLELQKGYDELIEVWNKLFQKYSDWKLEIYGEGSLKKELQEKIDKLGMTNSLLLKGVDKNIMDKYLKSSIYVMSSRYEGFGMVLVEAMACGLPVISFDCPCGPKDIIKDGEDGFLIRNRDLNEMANKLEFLIKNEEKRKNMGEKAHQNIARYSKDKVMLQWKNLFEELVNKKEK